jgi:hypothetical protein
MDGSAWLPAGSGLPPFAASVNIVAPVCDARAVRAVLSWLLVAAVVVALTALRMRPLATAVAVAWLVWCVYTWVRPARQRD